MFQSHQAYYFAKDHPMPLPSLVVNTQGLVVRGDRFMVIVRGDGEAQAPGTLSAPGGKVEFSDANDAVLEETLRREILEETGVTVGKVAYLRSSRFTLDSGEPVVDIAFLCEFVSGKASIADPVEVAEVLWLTLEEIDAHHRTPPWTRATVNAAEKLRMLLGAEWNSPG